MPDIIGINTHKDSTFDSFVQTVNSIHHECTHMLQNELAQLHETENINPDHPLYEDSRLWHYLNNIDTVCYIQRVKDAYLTHPKERDAYRQGLMFQAGIGYQLARIANRPPEQKELPFPRENPSQTARHAPI